MLKDSITFKFPMARILTPCMFLRDNFSLKSKFEYIRSMNFGTIHVQVFEIETEVHLKITFLHGLIFLGVAE